jgi:hypothetical protein
MHEILGWWSSFKPNQNLSKSSFFFTIIASFGKKFDLGWFAVISWW